jgi:hypothetical protein
LSGESSEDFKKDECPGLFSAGKQGDGKVQEVRHVLASLPGLCYRRFRLIEFAINPFFQMISRRFFLTGHS